MIRSWSSALCRATAIVGFSLTCALGKPASLEGQASSTDWFGGIHYDHETFSGSSPVWSDWSTVRALAVRRFDRFSLGLEAASVERFELSDRSLAGEIYLDLWEGAYAHLRVRGTPQADLLPRADLRIEVFNSLGGGWEGSGSLWRMNVAGPEVTVFGVGVARYQAEWLLRGQGTLARIAGDNALSGGIFARRFLGTTSREYFEFGAGTGNEIVVLGAGPILDSRSTWFLSGRVQRMLHQHLGVNLGAGLSDFEGIPLRRTLSLGLIAQF